MKNKNIIVVFFLLLICSSCAKDDPKGKDPIRTVLVYMVASNLGGNLQADLKEMEQVATKKNLNGGNLIVFYSSVTEQKVNGELFQFVEDSEGNISRKSIRKYEDVVTVSPDFMREIINNVTTEFVADSYGMIFSSHGTAWMPSNFSSMLRSFGEEKGKWMEINELAEAIPNNLFDFILFDACSMASIECVYELKDKAEYIIASPSETLTTGFPYNVVLPYFFTRKVNLPEIAKGFYNYYNTGNSNSFGNISVTKTNELEALADITREIISTAGMEAVYGLPIDNLQTLSNFLKSPTKLYDFGHVINELATSEQYDRFQIALKKAVTDTYYTTNLYCTQGGYYTVERFSGLSFYPFNKNLTTLNDWYKSNLKWYDRVYK